MGFQEGRHGFLVLLRGEGAGGIHQPASGCYQPGGTVQNLPLAAGTHLNRLLAPVGDGGFLLAEHALSGAGGIHQHPVEEAGESAG